MPSPSSSHSCDSANGVRITLSHSCSLHVASSKLRTASAAALRISLEDVDHPRISTLATRPEAGVALSLRGRPSSVLSLVEFVGGILEVGAFLVETGGGWRFLLSSRYRSKTRARWKRERRLIILGEIVGATIGICSTVAFVVWIGFTLLP